MKNFWKKEDIDSELQSEDFQRTYNTMKELYHSGKIPKLNEDEMDVLRFCHDRDMVQFLKEEFTRHPIVLDENGGLKYGNPFDKERGGVKRTDLHTVFDATCPPQTICD